MVLLKKLLKLIIHLTNVLLLILVIINTTYGNYNTNSGYYNSFVQPNELVNSWLRANFNDTSTTRKFKLIQDKFYFICGATEFGMLEVKQKDEDNSPVEIYHKSYFNTNDYLEIWDTSSIFI